MTIKPALYLFDPDQTHDLLWAEKIDSQISNLMSDAFGISGLFWEGNLPINLVERYIPGGDNIPWANEWTTKAFNFLKTLSKTHLLNDAEINGSIYGFNPEYTANLPSELDVGGLKAVEGLILPATITIKVTKNQTGIVSWLESNHLETGAGKYCNKVSNDIKVWVRRYRIIKAYEEDVTVELFSGASLHNSYILQNATIENELESTKFVLLYEKLDEVLQSIEAQLNLSEPKILTSLDVTLTSDYIKIWRNSLVTLINDYNIEHEISYSSPTFQDIPSSYYFASLLYAVPPKKNNNSIFTLEEPKEDLGKNIVILVTFNEDSYSFTLFIYSFWLKNNENLVSVPLGTDLYTGSKETIFTVSLINNIASAGVTATIVTYSDNHNPNPNMPRIMPQAGVYSVSSTTIHNPNIRPINQFNPFTVNSLSELATATESIYWVNNKNSFYVKLSDINDENLVDGNYVFSVDNNSFWVKAPYSASYPIGQFNSVINYLTVPSIEGKNGFYFYADLNYSVVDNGRIDYFPAWIVLNNLSGNTNYNYKFNSVFVSVQFRADNLYLFSSMQSILFRNDLEGTRETTYIYNEEGYFIRVYEEIGYFEVITRIVFTENINDEGVINITTVPTINNSNTKYTNNGFSEIGYSGIEQPEEITGTIISSERLTRTVRTSPIQDNLYITFQGTNKVNLSVGQILALIEPSPGVFYCDPDTDPLQNKNQPVNENSNDISWVGDIMPDSIRIKEIHAALQADKFAKDDNFVNLPRVANLGYYIERISRVLGISVNSDGSIRSIRQRKVLIPSTEGEVDIPAGWGRGQWQINIGGNTEGQGGGNSNEVRDGIVYANRSNRNVPSEFNEEAFNLEPPSFVLCENILQYIESYLEDLDAGLNWQEMGAMAIPAAFNNDDGTRKYCTYEGMGSLLAEVAFMLSSVSQSTSQTFVSSLVTQAISKAVLEALGVPLDILVQEILNMGEGGYEGSKIPIPALSNDSPTLVGLLLNVIENQARILGSSATLDLTSPVQENTQQ